MLQSLSSLRCFLLKTAIVQDGILHNLRGFKQFNFLCDYTLQVRLMFTFLKGKETDEPDILYKKLNIIVKGHEPAVLNSYELFVKETCKNLSLDLLCETRNRPEFRRLSLNKSPFIYKKHRRHYEFRTHYKYFTVTHITGCTADIFMEYIQRNIPEGVAMEINRHQVSCLPEDISKS